MKFEYRDYELSNAIVDIAAGPFGSNLKVSCFTETGFPIIDGANLKGITVTDNITKFVSEDKARSLHRSIAKRRDIVVTISGNVGQVSYIPDNSQYAEYLCSQRQFRVTFDESKIYVPYLVYYLHSVEGQSKILAFANQTGVPALSQPLKNFRKIKIDLPSLAEQKKIAAILSALDEKIATNRAINDNLEQQAQAIFKSWFIDFEPFSNRKPSDWSVSTLGNVSIIGAGGDKPQNVSPIKTDLYEYPIYANGLSNAGLYGFTDKPKISEESVTVSARGTIGFVCLRHIPYVPIVRLVTLIPKTEIISAKYLYLWLKQLHITGTGTTQQQLTVPDFQKTEILVPSQEIVTLFTATVEPIFEKIWANQNENEKLSSLRDTLLPKLMSGELDVSAVEL